MKGVILAGGRGTRLWPLTLAVSKQLLPVYDKPLIYYPLSTMMLAGIRDILIITTPQDLESYQRLLGNGHDWGVNFSFLAQPSPDGLAQAFILGESFIGDDRAALILGDNIHYGHRLSEMLDSAVSRTSGATVFSYYVGDPERYGVLEFDQNGKPVGIEEKPKVPKSQWALTGLYFFDNRVVPYAHDVKPSARGELEITDVLQRYLDSEELAVERLGRGFTWIDCGTTDSLIGASEFVRTIQSNQDLMVACPEEVALYKNFIDTEQVRRLAEPLSKTHYGQYLISLADRQPS